MSFEEELRRSMSERAGAVRTEPDSADLAARIGRAELRSQRVQRSAQVFALVLVTGSVGGFVGAYAHRSTPAVAASSKAPGPRSASETTLPSGLTSNSWTPLTSETDGADQPSVTFSFAATVHDQHANGFSVEWALSSNTSPLAVTLGPSGIACLPTRAVTLLVSSKGTPLASGTGVVGVPPLDRNGLAVVSAGSFGSPGLPGGWWAVVEAGSASKTIVAQFPNGQVDTSRVSSTGLAVVAGLDNGQIPEGPQDVTFTSENSIGDWLNAFTYTVGSGPEISGPSTVSTQSAASTACKSGVSETISPSSSGSGASASTTTTGGAATTTTGGGSSQQGYTASQPADPVVAAGAVAEAFLQAYTVDPYLGLTANQQAVAMGSSAGCPGGVFLGASSSLHETALVQPGVTVYAVAFPAFDKAVVVYSVGRGAVETGSAVMSAGVWKVSRSTYCGDTRG